MKRAVHGVTLTLVMSLCVCSACGDESKPDDVVDEAPDASAERDAALPVPDAAREDAAVDAGRSDAVDAEADAEASDAGSDAQVAPTTYSIGGHVEGLVGTLVLQNSGVDDLSLSANGDFTFARQLLEGDAYDVTIAQQPANQRCSLTGAQGQVETGAIDDIAVVCVPITTTLVTSVSALATSVTGLVEFGVAGTPTSGVSRVVTITNTGVVTATGLGVSNPGLPIGSTLGTTCAASLAPGASCTFTVTPGATSSSDGAAPCATGTAPVPSTIIVRGDNTNVNEVQIVVLDYGCIYGGGHVFSFDDTTPNTGSVGAKVWSTVDQAAGPNAVLWGSIDGVSVANDAIFGISTTSTPAVPFPAAGQVAGQVACSGQVAGACNTNNVYAFYNQVPPGAPINPLHYAAGQCSTAIAGHTDWYLPAICELGYGGACGARAEPVTQNVYSSLVEGSVLGIPQSTYWSSTQSATLPQNRALAFTPSGPLELAKSDRFAVRCARAF